MAQDSPADPLLARLEALEMRVHELEDRAPSTPPSAPTSAPEGAESSRASDAVGSTDVADPFWALTALKEHEPSPGAVVFAGAIDVGLGHLEYQWGRPVEHLLAADWAEHAEPVAALGHPLRLAILRRLLDGEHTVAQIVDELELGSTGVAYHHLSALQSGGWAMSPRRGSWSIPASRVVPLLAIITALEKG
ncbi:helix-turn-helix domain-containing protein [Brachybacterium tyrofermentans]|uniref:helix-turn-helix domain-containing protein n=1 Tax=Brachybacterium tyrofermentans TaxID=47848 RepID=UPI000A1B5206|nr:hypothetical protein FM103_04600 [Corynebacterium xerosis]